MRPVPALLAPVVCYLPIEAERLPQFVDCRTGILNGIDTHNVLAGEILDRENAERKVAEVAGVPSGELCRCCKKGMENEKNMNHHGYVHGYSERESVRLSDQAATLTDLLHHDTRYPRGSQVLEAGCGIGAQTRILAQHSPGAEIISIDQSDESLARAAALIEGERITNVRFQKADIFNLPYEDGYFDHIFVCFVLEHLSAPQKALTCLKRVLREGGTITVIEGDHGSCYFHPETAEAVSAWHSLIQVQRRMGGDSLIGRRVYPLLSGAGFRHPDVSPRMVYIDCRMPGLQEGFIKRTIIPMVEGVSEEAMSLGIIDRESFMKGIEDLHRTAAPDGTFCYTFFKGFGVR